MATASPYADFVAPDTVRYRWDGITVSGTGGKQSLNGGRCSLTFAAYATTWSNLSLSLRGSLDGINFFDARALRFLNRAYQAVWSGGNELNPEIDETWWWLRSSAPGVLTLDPVIETGTVSVTNNSTSITFSIAPTPSVALRYFKTTDQADVFRISAHTAAATAATLDSVYTGDTHTAATYKVMAIEYTLASDVKNLIGPMRAYQDQVYRIEGIDENSLDRDYPLREIQGGVPRAFSMITNSKVRFSHYGGSESTDLIRVD